jgi:hypothetical protein
VISVIPIKPRECNSWLIDKHYAKRLCPISYAFGAYRERKLIGIVTFGTPASAPLRNGICGEKYAGIVLELNRLCCENGKNIASKLISSAMNLLPKPAIVVSYADVGMGHVGYVYQATNFIYTGLSAKRTDWKIKGQEHLHGATVADISRGQENRAEYMREKYGDDFYLEERSRKHRYIFVVGNRYQKREIMQNIKYKIQPYPKGESRRYDAGGIVATQEVMFI